MIWLEDGAVRSIIMCAYFIAWIEIATIFRASVGRRAVSPVAASDQIDKWTLVDEWSRKEVMFEV